MFMFDSNILFLFTSWTRLFSLGEWTEPRFKLSTLNFESLNMEAFRRSLRLNQLGILGNNYSTIFERPRGIVEPGLESLKIFGPASILGTSSDPSFMTLMTREDWAWFHVFTPMFFVAMHLAMLKREYKLIKPGFSFIGLMWCCG